MAFSTVNANLITNNAVGRSATGGPFSGITYVGLSTTTINADATGITEPPSESGLARKLLGNSAIPSSLIMSASVNGASSNTEQIAFNETKSVYAPITDIFFTGTSTGAITGANLWAFGKLSAPLSPLLNTVILIRPGDLTFKTV